MKQKIDFKKILPHIVVIAGFLLLITIYFSPVLEGKILKQHDIIMAKSMQHETLEHLKNTGEFSLWTNSIFSGMPNYMVWIIFPKNIASYLIYTIRLYLPEPLSYIFVYFFCFYILMLVLKISIPVSAISAFAFAFTSYNFINVEAGHLTKALAMGIAPLILAGFILALQKKYFWGLVLSTIALALQIRANHYQITYYTLIVSLILFIVEFIHVIKNKTFSGFFKSIGVLAVAGIIALGVNIQALWTTQEYTKYTMRGGSELQEKQNTGKGLEKDYALSWSYGVKESFTLLVPYFAGGASSEELGPNSKLAESGISRQALKNIPTYWGTLATTAGPIYIGSVILFLFVLGMFVVKHHYKWWIFSSAVLTLMLSWGENFPALTNLFFDYFPMYNKFRVPMTLLLMVGLMVPVLSALAINEFLTGKTKKDEYLKALKYSFYGIGGLTLFFALFGGSLFSFIGQIDETLEKNNWPIDLLREDRAKLLRTDAFRSFFFILVTAAALFAWLKNKIKTQYVLVIIGLSVVIDMWGVDKRYFNSNDFHRKPRGNKALVDKTAADEAILKDPDPHYRVLDLTTNPWADCSKAYFHKLIGGYHGAKMARYQEMIEKHFSPEIEKLATELNKTGTVNFNLTPALNMMNAKYIIVSNEANGVLPNSGRFGNCWFVDSLVWVNNADEEINTLSKYDLRKYAVVDKKFKDMVSADGFPKDNVSFINFGGYKPNELKYLTKSNNQQLAVFSEVYYDKGWNAYLDGKLVPHFRVNYILRAMLVPAGEHEIIFKFEPKSYYTGEKISILFSIIIILMILGLAYIELKPLFFNKSNKA